MKAKYLLLLPILFFLQSCFVSEKSLYNEETNGKTTVTKINVPMFLVKPYIKKALREDGESKEVINLIRKIKRVKVYTVENATEKMATNFSRQSFSYGNCECHTGFFFWRWFIFRKFFFRFNKK